MKYGEFFGYFVGNFPVPDEIKKVKVDIPRGAASFQATFDYTADTAPCAMFKDYLGLNF
jgi:hypothetical protein